MFESIYSSRLPVTRTELVIWRGTARPFGRLCTGCQKARRQNKR